MGLLEELRAEGLKVNAVDGWETRGFSGFEPVGVMVHHTAGRDSLKLCINGRPGIPGPLCQLHLAKDGTVSLISVRKAYHAGNGSDRVLSEVRRGVAPSGTAKDRKLADTANGNAHFWGIEVENLGTGSDPYPEVQIDALLRLLAVLCRTYGFRVEQVIHHKEWTARKIDMSWGGDLRGLLRARLAGPAAAPAPTPSSNRRVTVTVDMPLLQRGAKGVHVVALQHLLNVKANAGLHVDGVYGDATIIAVQKYQRFFGLPASGMMGPETWGPLLALPA